MYKSSLCFVLVVVEGRGTKKGPVGRRRCGCGRAAFAGRARRRVGRCLGQGGGSGRGSVGWLAGWLAARWLTVLHAVSWVYEVANRRRPSARELTMQPEHGPSTHHAPDPPRLETPRSKEAGEPSPGRRPAAGGQRLPASLFPA